MGLPHLVAALSGSRAYRGELVSHGRNYRNAASPRPVDRQHVRNVLDYCRFVDRAGPDTTPAEFTAWHRACVAMQLPTMVRVD
ncbi:MAG: hypothetical protein C0483_18590 [Pirellula sp.]|nr:hypothetical protein [Pirellula sp.]